MFSGGLGTGRAPSCYDVNRQAGGQGILMWLRPCRLPGPSSKFRHAQGTVLHRDSHITNLKGLNLTTPGESDGFCANRLRVAVPLLSSGGQVAVLEVRDPTHMVPSQGLAGN